MKSEFNSISCATQTELNRKVTIKREKIFSKFYNPTSYPWKCFECFLHFQNFKSWFSHQNQFHPVLIIKQIKFHPIRPPENKLPVPPLTSNSNINSTPDHPANDPSDSKNSSSEPSTEEEDEVELSKSISTCDLLGVTLNLCNFCQKIFSNFNDAKNHVAIHAGEKTFESQFPALKNLKPSQKPVPRIRLQKYFKCSLCPRRFHYFYEWQIHIDRAHPVESPNANPEMVRPSANNAKIRSKLNIKSKTNTNHPKLAPDFKRKLQQKLKKNSQAKSKAANFILIKKWQGRSLGVCKICKKVNNNYSLALQHVRTHLGEKPFSCTICTKKFTAYSNAASHMSLHGSSKPKPNECSICRQLFSTIGSCNVHMRKKHGLETREEELS